MMFWFQLRRLFRADQAPQDPKDEHHFELNISHKPNFAAHRWNGAVSLGDV